MSDFIEGLPAPVRHVLAAFIGAYVAVIVAAVSVAGTALARRFPNLQCPSLHWKKKMLMNLAVSRLMQWRITNDWTFRSSELSWRSGYPTHEANDPVG